MVLYPVYCTNVLCYTGCTALYAVKLPESRLRDVCSEFRYAVDGDEQIDIQWREVAGTDRQADGWTG
jgi:hypothetical protein